MPFTHDTDVALQAAAVLANSLLEPDTLTDVADLDAVFEDYGYTGRHEGSRAELDAVRAIRPRLRDLLTAPKDDAVRLANALLEEAQAVPRLVRHDGWDWHLHAVREDADLASRILVETAMAMVDVIRADEMSRLGLCAAPGCEGVVVDLSRNRSKRFCSVACGNRTAVAAYRARLRPGTGAAPR